MTGALLGKVAIVTGASRGIGAAIARRLAADGFRVWIHYHRSGEAAEALLKEIQARGGQGLLLPFDVAHLFPEY